MNRKLKSVLDVVWRNQSGKRYIPLHNGLGPFNWDVWDDREKKWVVGKDVLKIDPTEPLLTN